MAWWWDIIESHLDRPRPARPRISDVKRKDYPPPKTFKQLLRDAFFEEAIDIVFFWLGIFTYVYFLAAVLLYFGFLHSIEDVFSKLINALAEPYLGAVGIYTILKEARKRRRGFKSRHLGELFVGSWLVFFIVASALAIFSDAYIFNEALEVVITVSLGVVIIFMGSLVHKP